jgi:hypothetical protein
MSGDWRRPPRPPPARAVPLGHRREEEEAAGLRRRTPPQLGHGDHMFVPPRARPKSCRWTESMPVFVTGAAGGYLFGFLP